MAAWESFRRKWARDVHHGVLFFPDEPTQGCFGVPINKKLSRLCKGSSHQKLTAAYPIQVEELCATQYHSYPFSHFVSQFPIRLEVLFLEARKRTSQLFLLRLYTTPEGGSDQAQHLHQHLEQSCSWHAHNFSYTRYETSTSHADFCRSPFFLLLLGGKGDNSSLLLSFSCETNLMSNVSSFTEQIRRQQVTDFCLHFPWSECSPFSSEANHVTIAKSTSTQLLHFCGTLIDIVLF